MSPVLFLWIASLLCPFFGGISCSLSYHTQLETLMNSGNIGADPVPHVEQINGTENFRIHRKRGKDEKTWFEGREMKHVYCGRFSKCEKLKETMCMGAKLPYNYTSLDLSDSYSQEQILDRLQTYQALKYVPKCWAVIQPFLCAVFLPKCESIQGKEYVYLPSLEMCRITAEPCRMLYNTTYFPDFLKCNESIYPSKCNNDVREIKFNVTGQCLKPLIQADAAANYYSDIEGCGLQCKDPLYTDDEHHQIHKLIGWGATLCLASNIFAITTFMIDWQNAKKHPALTIFYMNICYMMTCFGWLAQFTPGGREDIVCRKDGTLRHSEPSTGENLSCIVVFVLIYYFLIAAMVWFVIFLYAWFMSFKAFGKIHDKIDKKGSYFHLVAWSLPLVLTITIMALSEVDGNSAVGICFVGYLNHPMRALLLGPIVGVLLIGGYFVSGGMLILVKLKMESKEIISARASNKIRESIVRMGLCTLFTLVIILATIVCHIHEFRNSDDWAASLKAYILCKITTSYHEDYVNTCKLNSRPSVAILQLHLLCLFASGIVMSSWVWTHSTLGIWRRYIKGKFGYEVEQPVRMQKHKLIAQAFAKRKAFQEEGRLSISFRNTHTDPVGLNFNIDSAASQDFSSTWANNLPRFVNRRCALTGAVTSSSHEPRRNSMDSEISVSVRHVSVESRRNSVDSQVSVKIAEMKTKVASRGRTRKSKRIRRQDYEDGDREQRLLEYNANRALGSESHRKMRKFTSKGYKNTKRRSASAGLNPKEINSLLSNGKSLRALLNNAAEKRISSDEENGSVASFSRLDVILKKICNHQEPPTSDEESQDFIIHDNSVNKEYNTTDDEKMKHVSCNTNTLDNGLSSNDDLDIKEDCLGIRKSRRRHRNSHSGKLHDDESNKEAKSMDFGNYSQSSFDSEISIAPPVHSSYSGGKSNSRNSKRSCDVGIQANAYEITTQLSMAEKESAKGAAESAENQQTVNKKWPNEKESALSQTDKLKLLLLPSK